MKKQTFTGLVKLMEQYKNKCMKLGNDIAKAYVNAGCEKDFIQSVCYEPPYGVLFDDIVKTIANEFATDTYPAETAVDFIAWWMWECDFGKAKYYETGNSDSLGNAVEKPMAAVIFEDGKEMTLKTPAALYDAIMYDQKRHNQKTN